MLLKEDARTYVVQFYTDVELFWKCSLDGAAAQLGRS